jgi:vacuolar fusion protein MON1
VCLPKHNPSGFVNAYVNFLADAPAVPDEPPVRTSIGTETTSRTSFVSNDRDPLPRHSQEETLNTVGSAGQKLPPALPGVALLCVSMGGDFEAIRDWGDAVASVCIKCFLFHSWISSGPIQKLSDGIVEGVTRALAGGVAEYSVATLGVPGLRHFVYKSRAHVQVTLPRYEEPYHDSASRRR